MTTTTTASRSPWPRNLLRLVSALTYLLITMGGLICVTTPGKGCPDWPGCYGGVLPPPELGAIVEVIHRFLAALTLVTLIGAVVVCWRQARWLGRARWLPVAALILVLCVAAFGALAVLRGLSPALAAVDVGSALLVVGLVVAAALIAGARESQPGLLDQLTYRGPMAWMALAALAAIYFVIVSGMFAAGPGSRTQCLGGPLFGSALQLAQEAGWLQELRRAAAVAAALLVGVVATQAWRTLPRQSSILRAALIAAILFLVDIIIAVLLATVGFALGLMALSVAVTAGLWVALAALAVTLGLPAREA